MFWLRFLASSDFIHLFADVRDGLLDYLLNSCAISCTREESGTMYRQLWNEPTARI